LVEESSLSQLPTRILGGFFCFNVFLFLFLFLFFFFLLLFFFFFAFFDYSIRGFDQAL
jgi:hypothetical protein